MNPKTRPRVWPKVRAAIILVENDRLLLVRHTRDGRAYWVCPGGGVEYGETIEQSLHRELQEEVNLQIQVGNLVLICETIPPDEHRHEINFFFRGRICGGEPRLGEDKVVAEFGFFPLDEIDRLTIYPDIKAELREILQLDFRSGVKFLGNCWGK